MSGKLNTQGGNGKSKKNLLLEATLSPIADQNNNRFDMTHGNTSTTKVSPSGLVRKDSS